MKIGRLMKITKIQRLPTITNRLNRALTAK